jgi:hypothetical protein
MHESDSDYRAVFDHLDDLVILDGATSPTLVQFYQIKSRDKGQWTISRLVKKVANEPPPASTIGKMYKNAADFAEAVGCIGFITNIGFDFKLKNGSRSKDDHVCIVASELHDDELALINTCLDADFPVPRNPECQTVLQFERTNLPLRDQDVFVTGRLVKYLEKIGSAEHVPVKALYDALYQHVIAKTGVTETFNTPHTFVAAKSLCRADIESLFSRARGHKRFHDSWSLIANELLAANASSVTIIKIQNACLQYLSDRARGEPIATRFSTDVKASSRKQKEIIERCSLILDVVSLLKNDLSAQRLPYQVEQLDGALIVEAFEAVND